jgi:hypothetical protein
MADIDIGQQPGGQAGGTGGAVRIPIVPTVSAPLRDAPSISRYRGSGVPESRPVDVQPILAGIEGAGEKLGQIFAAQGQNQRALQANKAIHDYQNADTLARSTAMTTGNYNGTADDSMIGIYNQRSVDLQKTIRDNPANQAIFADPKLAAQVNGAIYDTHSKGMTDITLHQLQSHAQDQDADFKSQLHTGAIAAGPDYRVAPDGSFVDGPDSAQQRQRVENLADQVYGHMPGEKAAHMQAYDLDVASERAQSIAQNTNQPFLLDQFVKAQPAGTFTPQQMTHFHEMQRAAIKAPYDQAMAVNDAKVGATLNELNQMQAAHDPNLAAAAYKAEPLIGSEKTKAYVGESYHPPRTPEMPSQPGAVESWIKDVTANPLKYSSQDITAIDKDIMTTADKSKVHAALYDAQQAVKKPLGAAYMNGRRQIRDALTPTIDPFPEQTKQKVDEALEDYDTAYRGGAFQTVQDAIDGRDNVVKAYGAKKPVPPPRYVADPKKVAPTLTAGQIASAVKKARESGFVPTPGPISAPTAAPTPTATPAAAAESGGW